MRTMEQRRDVEELVKQVEELEQVRRKQAHKISSLKEEIASAGSQTQEKQVVAENAVQALSSELRTTKNALDSIKYREKQVRYHNTCYCSFAKTELSKNCFLTMPAVSMHSEALYNNSCG